MSISKQSRITVHGGNEANPVVWCCHLATGASSPCLSLLVGKHLLVFDAGASLRELGRASDILNNAQQLHLFLSHFHPTHIEGLPFFAPLFEAGRDVRIYARRTSSESAADTLNRHFSPPHFPIAFMGEQKVSNVSIVDLEPPGRIELDDATAIEYLHEPDPESGIAFHITLGAF